LRVALLFRLLNGPPFPFKGAIVPSPNGTFTIYYLTSSKSQHHLSYWYVYGSPRSRPPPPPPTLRDLFYDCYSWILDPAANTFFFYQVPSKLRMFPPADGLVTFPSFLKRADPSVHQAPKAPFSGIQFFTYLPHHFSLIFSLPYLQAD